MTCYVKDHGSQSNIMQGYNSFDNHDDGKHGNKSIEFPVLSSSPSNHQSGQRQFLNGNSPNISNSYPTKKNVISVDDAIEQLGMGGFQTRLLFALGLCFAADAMEILLLSFLAPVLEVEMDFNGKKMSKNEVSNYVKLFSPDQQQFTQPSSEYDRLLTEKPKNRPINRYQPPAAPQPMTVETEEFIETTSNSENWVCIFKVLSQFQELE